MTAKYSLTEEHRAQLQPWADKWIANAMSTAPMNEEDCEVCRRAVIGLYEAAKLRPPKHIVFVPSPFVARFAAGFAAAVWHLRKNSATYDATDAATDAATRDATDDATYAATDAATYDATDQDAWYLKLPWHDYAKRILGGAASLGLKCANYSWRMMQGGNQWSAYDSFLSFFRHIAKLPLDYSPWDHWERLSLHSGPRILHPEFCMISDRPCRLTVDEQNRPHSVVGPFCEWRDGTALFAWHGVRVPAKYYLREHSAKEILAEPNAEVRRALMERYDELRGKGRFIQDARARVLDSAIQPMRDGKPDAINELLSIDLAEDPDGCMVALKVIDPSTGRTYIIRVPPNKKTVGSALAWSFNVPEKQYVLEQES